MSLITDVLSFTCCASQNWLFPVRGDKKTNALYYGKFLSQKVIKKSINQSIYLCQYVGSGCADHPSQRLSWIFFTFSFSLTNNFSIHLICIDSFYRLDSCASQNNSKCGFTFQISVNVVALENQLGSKTYLIWLEFPPTVRGITFLIKCKII